MKKYLFVFLLIVFVTVFNFNTAFAAGSPTVNSVKVNDLLSVTVTPSTSITVKVNASTHDASSHSDWKSTAWRIATSSSGSFTCVNTTDLHNGTADRSFSVSTPSTNGTYNLYIKAYADDQSCDDGDVSSTFNLAGAVIVNSNGSLQVIKNTVGGNGTFSFTGGAGSFNITTVGNTGSTTRTNLTPGNYSVTETVPSGWDQTSNTCTNVAVTAGNTATCTITNTKRGSLTVYKDVVNPDGGAVSDNQSFSVTLNGANTQSVSENSSYSYTNLVPGTYTVEENVNANYDFMSFSADADPETSGAQVTVTAGANTNLTITNKQKQGTVTVNKVVTNPNGGSAVAGDFSFSINGGSPIQFIQNELNSLLGSNTFNWNPGAVSIAETVGQYAISYSGCNFVLASNGNNTCTITNSDIPEGQGAITVVKNVVNDNGGTKTVSDFNLYIGEMMVTSGQSNFLDPGEYTISEGELPDGYMQTSIVCSNGETETSGTVNLTAQSAWTCTITNDDKPAHLTIIKNTVNNALNGAMDGEFTFNLSGQETPIVLSTVEGMASTTIDVNAGNYTLTEIVPEDWKLTDISCESEGDEVSDGVSLSLSNGENLTCAFTNTRKMGSVKITKVIELGNGEKTVSDFMIHMSLNSEEVPESPKAGSEEGTVYGPFVTGTYKIFENNVIENGVGYAAHYDGDCDPTGMITIVDGEILECTVTNTRFVHSGGGSGGGSGEVLGAQTENTTTGGTTETPKEEPKSETKPTGEVLGETTCKPYLTSYMYPKKKNDVAQVKLLQEFLNEHLGLKLKVDGYFGNSTKASVISFQEKYADQVLKPWEAVSGKTEKGTGIVYKTTKWKINDLKCPGVEAFPVLP